MQTSKPDARGGVNLNQTGRWATIVPEADHQDIRQIRSILESQLSTSGKQIDRDPAWHPSSHFSFQLPSCAR